METRAIPSSQVTKSSALFTLHPFEKEKKGGTEEHNKIRQSEVNVVVSKLEYIIYLHNLYKKKDRI